MKRGRTVSILKVGSAPAASKSRTIDERPALRRPQLPPVCRKSDCRPVAGAPSASRPKTNSSDPEPTAFARIVAILGVKVEMFSAQTWERFAIAIHPTISTVSVDFILKRCDRLCMPTRPLPPSFAGSKRHAIRRIGVTGASSCCWRREVGGSKLRHQASNVLRRNLINVPPRHKHKSLTGIDRRSIAPQFDGIARARSITF